MVHAKLTRRRFIRGSVGVAGALAFPTIVSSRAFGANDRVQVACIGAGGKGEVDINGASAAGGTIAFLRQVHESSGLRMFREVVAANRYRDFRAMRVTDKESTDPATR